MKTFNIFCDGGFGNRLSALIGGLTLSRICNITPKIIWPSNSVCRAEFQDIFLNDYIEYSCSNIREYYDISSGFNLISNVSEYLKFFRTSRTDPEFLDLNSFLNVVESSEKPVFYYTPLLYDWIPKEQINKTIESLKFNNYITKEVDLFIQKTFDNLSYTGIHIRATDFINIESFDIDSIYIIVKTSQDKKFFICSDDQKVEERFSQLPNAYSYSKREYTSKLYPDQNWHVPYTDEDGRYSVFNVDRSKNSVIDAVIDFLILSKSDIIKTGNHSTFLKMAMIVGDSIK